MMLRLHNDNSSSKLKKDVVISKPLQIFSNQLQIVLPMTTTNGHALTFKDSFKNNTIISQTGNVNKRS